MSSILKCDWTLAGVLLDNCGNLGDSEQVGYWPVQDSTLFSFFFIIIPKNVISERPCAVLSTLFRSWEWLRAPGMQEWTKRSRASWDATEVCHEGAERTAWEALLEMERYKYFV